MEMVLHKENAKCSGRYTKKIETFDSVNGDLQSCINTCLIEQTCWYVTYTAKKKRECHMSASAHCGTLKDSPDHTIYNKVQKGIHHTYNILFSVQHFSFA